MKTYHIISIGCQMNKSDSERLSAYLNSLNFKKNHDKYSSDLVILFTCGVRQSAENRIYGLLPRIKKYNPKVKIILSGCLSERHDVKKRMDKWVDIWLPTKDMLNLAEKLKIKAKEINYKNYLHVKPNYESKFSAFVPIGNGCNNFCTYCVVPYARGRELYRNFNEIINEVENLIKHNYKEIILIAQNVNSYKHKSKDFADLLAAVNKIDGNFWIRFATSHPKDISEKLINTIAKCDKVCEHIHLPAQAGNNEILKAMNRKYTIKHYKDLIKKIRIIISPHKALPVSLTTDIIVGFPGETKKQFNDTKKLFKEVKYDMAYIAQYSPRPGTAAGKLKDNIPNDEKKLREEELMKILRKTSLNKNKLYKNKIVEVLVDKKRSNFYFGKTRTNKVVKFKKQNNKNLIGKFIKVKITQAEDFGLSGEEI